MDALLKNIHDYIDEVVEEFIKKHFHNKLQELSIKHDVDMDNLKSILELDREFYENTRCKANTILGKACKYKSCEGESYCIKHKKLLSLK